MKRPVVSVVAAGLINSQKKVLLARRPEGKDMAGLWEFPGGKVRTGESRNSAIVRELEEEINIKLKPSTLLLLGSTKYPYDDFLLLMTFYLCRQWIGEPEPLEGQELIWIHLNQIKNYEMPPADLPLIYLLQENVDKLFTV